MNHMRGMVAALFALVALVAAACGGGGSSSPKFEAVASALAGSSYYVEDGAPPVDLGLMSSAIDKATAAGIDMRAVVLATPESPVTAEDLTNEFGGTALVVTPTEYYLSTTDFGENRLRAAEQTAKDALTSSEPGAALDAFVNAAIANQDVTGGESGGDGGFSPLVWIVAAIAALILLAAVLRYLASRRRIAREAADFTKRRDILRDWASTLDQPLTELRDPVAASNRSNLVQGYQQAVQIARESGTDLAGAAALPDLDRSEMRIARAHMLLRQIREAL